MNVYRRSPYTYGDRHLQVPLWMPISSSPKPLSPLPSLAARGQVMFLHISGTRSLPLLTLVMKGRVTFLPISGTRSPLLPCCQAVIHSYRRLAPQRAQWMSIPRIPRRFCVIRIIIICNTAITRTTRSITTSSLLMMCLCSPMRPRNPWQSQRLWTHHETHDRS